MVEILPRIGGCASYLDAVLNVNTVMIYYFVDDDLADAVAVRQQFGWLCLVMFG